jgi:hypothetical protein
LHRPPELPEPTRWGRLVHVRPAGGSADELEARGGDGAGLDLRGVGVRIRRLLFGPPFRSSAIVRERMRKSVALPVLWMGDRLAFNHGIIALSLLAAVVFVAFGGNTASLIPLFAVGVFLAFTFSQAGMVVHWWRLRGPGWRTSISFNAVGCISSAIVFLVAAITKVTAGAWLACVIVVGFTVVGLLIRRHFDQVAHAVALTPGAPQDGEAEDTPSEISNLAIVPVSTLNRATVRALAYAVSLRQPVLALHVTPTEEEGERFRQYWRAWGEHVPLEVIESPYRAVVAPTIAYIESLHAQRPDLTLTVIVPELALRHWWQRPLHDNDASRLRRALEPLSKIVVTTVPLHV